MRISRFEPRLAGHETAQIAIRKAWPRRKPNHLEHGSRADPLAGRRTSRLLTRPHEILAMPKCTAGMVRGAQRVARHSFAARGKAGTHPEHSRTRRQMRCRDSNTDEECCRNSFRCV